MPSSRVPRKITPDTLEDTIVEVHYEASLPSEVLYGLFHQAVVPAFTYLRPAEKTVDSVAQLQAENKPEPVFFGKGIFFSLLGKSIAFNCSNGYLGWEEYRKQIESVLSILHQTGNIKHFISVRTRYINALPMEIYDDQLTFRWPNLTGLPPASETFYKSTLKPNEDEIVILVLTDTELMPGEEKPKTIFDIDVSLTLKPTDSLETLLSVIDRAHQREKDVFFSLVSNDFVTTRNPLY